MSEFNKTDYANSKITEMIREYIATTEEAETLSDDILISEYLDCYNVGMDMFNLGFELAKDKSL